MTFVLSGRDRSHRSGARSTSRRRRSCGSTGWGCRRSRSPAGFAGSRLASRPDAADHVELALEGVGVVWRRRTLASCGDEDLPDDAAGPLARVAADRPGSWGTSRHPRTCWPSSATIASSCAHLPVAAWDIGSCAGTPCRPRSGRLRAVRSRAQRLAAHERVGESG